MEGKSQPQVPFTGVPTTPSVDPELVDSRAGMADVRDYPRREDAEVPGPLGVINGAQRGACDVRSSAYLTDQSEGPGWMPFNKADYDLDCDATFFSDRAKRVFSHRDDNINDECRAVGRDDCRATYRRRDTSGYGSTGRSVTESEPRYGDRRPPSLRDGYTSVAADGDRNLMSMRTGIDQISLQMTDVGHLSTQMMDSQADLQDRGPVSTNNSIKQSSLDQRGYRCQPSRSRTYDYESDDDINRFVTTRKRRQSPKVTWEIDKNATSSKYAEGYSRKKSDKQSLAHTSDTDDYLSAYDDIWVLSGTDDDYYRYRNRCGSERSGQSDVSVSDNDGHNSRRGGRQHVDHVPLSSSQVDVPNPVKRRSGERPSSMSASRVSDVSSYHKSRDEYPSDLCDNRQNACDRRRSYGRDSDRSVAQRPSRKTDRHVRDQRGQRQDSDRPLDIDRQKDKRRDENKHRRRRHTHSSSSTSSDTGSDHSSERSVRRHHLKPAKFDGTGSFETFYATFMNCAEYNSWKNKDRLAHLKSCLVGEAGQILWDSSPEATNTLDKLVELLRNRFSGSRQADKYRMELRLRRRKNGESLSSLHRDIRRLMALAHPDLPQIHRETIACDYFIDSIDDPDFALKVRERNPGTLDEALRVALQLEAWCKDAVRVRAGDDKRFSTRHARGATAEATDETVRRLQCEVERLTHRVEQLTSASKQTDVDWRAPVGTAPDGHHIVQTDWQRDSYQSNKPATTNSRSKQTGIDRKPWTEVTGMSRMPNDFSGGGGPREFGTNHLAPTDLGPSPNPSHAGSSVNVKRGSVVPDSSGSYHRFTEYRPTTCWYCDRPGHRKRDCFKRKSDMTAQGTTGSLTLDPAVNRGASRQLDKADVYLKMKLYGHNVKCLVDSGCEVSMVPFHLVNNIRQIHVVPVDEKVVAANGSAIQISGRATLSFRLNGRVIETAVLVSRDIEEPMLGSDWLKQYNCVWDFGANRLFVAGRPAIPISRKGPLRCRRVYIQGDIVIPPRRQLDVDARSPLISASHSLVDDHAVEAKRLSNGVYVARTLLPADTSGLKVRVVNTSSAPRLLRDGTCLGRSETAQVLLTEVQPSGPSTNNESSLAEVDALSKLLDNLPGELNADKREQARTLLDSYRDVFSMSEYDVGRTDLVYHHIETGNHRPIRQPLRRHPIAHLEQIDKQVDEMLQHGIIERAASPWSSNVVLVRKKDKSYRFCVDYRSLNSITYQDTYPLPHIDTCLDALKESCWFSTLDLRSGYHCIPIWEADKDKTAFITRRGSWRYNVMPFGLTCAPSVFQRLMDLVLCGLSYDICMVYLDDIIVFSSDFATHLERLATVFDRLRSAKLKLKPSKCCLLQRKVSFLGHVVSGKGIEMQNDKLSAVRDWPVPKNVHEVRAFLGLCSYYRRFVAGFSGIAAPLHALTQKGISFHWGQLEQTAFDELKDRLSSAPILGIPRDGGTFVLDTDASNTGLGAVLSQQQDGCERVISYASRTLSKSEKNYSTTRKELLAMIYGLKQYRQYLLGRSFIIRTDHSALQWLRRTTDLIGQEARWLTFIEQFQYTIVHRAGSRHMNADALSRRPVSAESEEEDDVAVVRTVQLFNPPLCGLSAAGERQNLATLQREDPIIGRFVQLRMEYAEPPCINELLQESKNTKVLWSQWYRLTVRDGVVYRILFSRCGEPDGLQLLAPKCLIPDIIRGSHEGMTGGHFGLKRTLDQVQRRAYWLGWRQDVTRYIKRCVNCNCYHRGQLPKKGHLQPIVAGAPFERLSIDLTGPHIRSKRGAVFILTCIDPFTKWAEAFALPNKEAVTVAKVLVEKVFCRFGVPIAVLSDNGMEVDSSIMRELCKLLGVDKLRTTVYKASTNAAVERFHRTLNTLIAKVLDDDQKEWDAVLPYVMAAYRATRHESTGYTPNYLTLGREVKGPLDVMLGTETIEQSWTYDDYVENVQNRMQYAYTLVRKHLGIAAERCKHYYDIRVRPQQFSVGDAVYYFNPRNLVNKQNKWCRKYTGPYKIIKVLGPVNFLLQKPGSKKTFVSHIDKLKLCITDSSTEMKDVERSKNNSDSFEQPNVLVEHSKVDLDKPIDCDMEIPISRTKRTIRRPRRYDT